MTHAFYVLFYMCYCMGRFLKDLWKVFFLVQTAQIWNGKWQSSKFFVFELGLKRWVEGQRFRLF